MLYIVDDEMWVDAGRTCNTDDDNRRIDWKNGLVTVTVSPFCSTLTKFLIYSLPFVTKHGNSHTPYKKASSYIAQYPVLRTVQSALHFTSLTDLFTQTLFRLLLEASSHMLQLMFEGCSYT